MKRLLTVAIPILVVAQLTLAEEPARERIEWTDIWVTDADKNDLPRVLLIGDSITRGYFGDVEKRLSGKAFCARLTTSTSVADPSFSDEVLLLLKRYKFAVIHFNNGLHGWGYDESQYRTGLLRLVQTFEKHAAGAKLIWVTTTPVRTRGNLRQISQRTERVRARNRVAASIMRERGIPTNDLFELVERHPEWQSGDGVHFNQEGKKAQGAAVAASVSKCLSQTAGTPGRAAPR